jgi:uncharacterized damage-inducible protein DinB
MRRHLLAFVVSAGFAGVAPVEAQSFVEDFSRSTVELEEKLIGLANALTAEQYNWTPGPGVRNVREVLLHIAADNYFIPAAAGHASPANVRITDYKSTIDFEKQNLSKEETIAAVKASFVHLRTALQHVREDALKEKMKVFGQEMTGHQLALLTVNHLHEHLGQMIAYARMNGVKPPWSR